MGSEIESEVWAIGLIVDDLQEQPTGSLDPNGDRVDALDHGSSGRQGYGYRQEILG